MKKLRLLLFEECDRHCVGCCNNDWDLDKLPIVKSYVGYDIISITGGEPLLIPSLVKMTIWQIRKETTCLIYLYTAKINDINAFLNILMHVDGICLTLHEQSDMDSFIALNEALTSEWRRGKSMRLNVFQGINMGGINLKKWKVKREMEWIKDCPLPENEVFMRI